MNNKLKLILTVASVAALAGCSKETSFVQSFANEAGGDLDEGGFGNPTMNNILVQTGQKSYAIDLTNRFAAEVPATVNFAFNSAKLDATAQAALRKQANWIKQFPEVRFRVYGHTDLVGSNAYNKRLGLRRARAVVNFLVRQGISRKRLEAVASFGENQPLVVTPNRERRNRRTVTEVSGFVQNHPLVLNGKYAQIIFRDYVESAVEPTTIAEVQGSEVNTGN
ncbi:MAG TPA: OmpA family protein [Rhodobacteraceae bacterium]|nr:OmpA family protein [Paracoccaceae bacterium]